MGTLCCGLLCQPSCSEVHDNLSGGGELLSQLSSKRKKQGEIKKGKTETTNQKEQHGEDELNDVGTNVVTLDEEVIDHLLLHSLV